MALLLVASAATAIEAEPTREEYVAAAEPICKANTQANSRILKGVKRQVQKDQLAPAGRRFLRAATALGKAVNKIAALPKPSADKVKLDKWVGFLRSEKSLLRGVGKALKAENKVRAQKLAVKLNDNNTSANNTVISFGFDHCRIESSKFL